MDKNELIDKEEAQEEAKSCPEPKKEKKYKKKEFEHLEAELAEAKDCWMRTLAEYDNFRKRSQKEREALYANSKADVLSKFLPVLDNFERAAENQAASYEDYRKGMDMIIQQFIDIMKGLDVEAFGQAGDAFDPNMHNAVQHIEDDEYGENEVFDVFQKGYKMGERVLRPAAVRVAN